MAANISFRDVNFTSQATSVLIVVTTNIPCHLYCRLTSEEPRIHLKPVTRRGLSMLSDLRFCFVSYEDNEQTEPGNGLIHTWIKPAWGPCVTKHCYFWGYVWGALSPSTTCIFHYHNTYTPPPFTGIGDEAIDRLTNHGTGWSWLSTNKPSTGPGTVTNIQYYVAIPSTSLNNAFGLFRWIGLDQWLCVQQLSNLSGLAGYHAYNVNWPAEAGDCLAWGSQFVNLDCTAGSPNKVKRSTVIYADFHVGLILTFSIATILTEMSLHANGHA